jgi:hypothetical protein
MGEYITIYPYNIFELGTPSVTGDADTGYPEARLWDRSRNCYWKDTVTEAKVFLVDQGSSPLNVDLLAILNHNFDGKDMQWQYSTDNFGADINDAVTDWAQSGYGDIIKTLGSAQNKRYWRVTLSSITNPMCAEIYMSKGYAFNIQADPSPGHGFDSNVLWSMSVGGEERSILLGEDKRRRNYFLKLGSTDLASFVEAIGYLNHWSYPFFFKDKDGSYFMARFDTLPMLDYSNKNYTGIDISIIEVL